MILADYLEEQCKVLTGYYSPMWHGFAYDM